MNAVMCFYLNSVVIVFLLYSCSQDSSFITVAAGHCWKWLIILQHWLMVLVICLQLWKHVSCIWCRREDSLLMRIFPRYAVCRWCISN